jgi:uncharacterized protein YhaN
MRIGRLDLLRFGKFADHVVDLPAGRPDFHLIVGPNEAGKSTIRCAISDLLFGIEMQSPFDFRYRYAEMCLGAVIEQGASEPITFRRLKRNRQALRDAADNPLPDDLLAGHLGGVDQKFFERMFGLDHGRLVEGGLEILKAKDDVGRMLFEASSGLGSLGGILETLEREARNLWDKRRARDRAYYKAFDAFQDAERSLRTATVRTREWMEVGQRVADATAMFNGAVERHQKLEEARFRLERVRRVAPHFQARKRLMDDRTLLGETVLLPEAASAQLSAAESAIAAADLVILQQQALIEKAESEQSRISVDHRLLGRREEVIALAEHRNRVRDHPVGILKRTSEMQTLRKTVEDIVRQLGWALAEDDTLLARIPSEIVRAEIQGLLQQHGRLEQAMQSADEAVTDREVAISLQEDEIARLPGVYEPVRLKVALDRARSLGDADAQARSLRDVFTAAGRRLEETEADLKPWTGTIAQLRALALPDGTEALDVESREQAIRQELKTLQAQIYDIDLTLTQRQHQEAQIQRDRKPITGEEVEAVRARRDEVWQQIKAGQVTIADQAEDYEARISTADALADRRYLCAADAHKLEDVRNGIEQLRLKREDLGRRGERLKCDLSQLATAWSAQMSSAGLGDMTAKSFPTWLQHRRKALDEANFLAEAKARLVDFEQNVSDASRQLQQALSETASPATQVIGLGLRDLIDRAEASVTQAETIKTRHEALQAQIANAKNALVALRQKADQARARMKAWERTWADNLIAANLPAEAGLAAASAALGLFSRLSTTLNELRMVQQSRIATMQRDLDGFAASATSLAAALAPEFQELNAEEISRELSRRLEQTERAKAALDQTTKDLANARKALGEAKRRREESETALEPLLNLARSADVRELRAAIDRSEKFRGIEGEIQTRTRTIVEGGDGLSLEALEAEVTAEDLPTIEAKLQEIKMQLGEAVSAREKALLQKKEAEAELAKIHGQADAASTEARRQEALAAMADATERFIKVYIAARLLQWAIERFRAERQDPLLRRAGEIFARLTIGSFEKLAVDFDDNVPHLKGRRPDGSQVGVDGMSDGSRDQLYLALRLAAIELHLRNGRALPFVADDLLINFDDARAAAGFAVLGELAKSTQVLYLTHHDHLVPIARHALGPALNVVSL